MRTNLCITGLRSVGKTTVAKALGKAFGMPCYDTDEIGDRWLAARGSSFTEEMRHKRYGEIYEAILSELPLALNLPGGSVISAAWGCFEHPDVALLLRTCSLVVGLTPAFEAEGATEILFSRERARPHFDYLDDDGLIELCRRDASRALRVLADYCDVWLPVGRSDPETVQSQLTSILWQ